MKIFITGGTGFLGKPLLKKLLGKGHQVLILKKDGEKISKEFLKSKSRISFLNGNLQNINKLLPKIKSFKPEVGIHLAWEGIPSADLELNLKNLNGGLNCLETLAKAGVKRIFVAGSCHEYGEPRNVHRDALRGNPGKKVSETNPLNPFNMLYAAKIALYFLGSKIAETHNVKLIWGRIGFVYGPGQRKASLIPHLLNSIQKNEEPVLKNPKGGNDFIYVDDVAGAISALIKKKNLRTNEIFNIGSGKLTGVMEIVKIIYRQAKLSVPKHLKDVKKPEGFCLGISKIKFEVGWQPKVNIDLGIKKTIGHYKSK